MKGEPCIERGNLLNFSAMHFAVFSKIQGVFALGAFLIAAYLAALYRTRANDLLLLLRLRWVWARRDARVVSREERFLRWLSLLEKRDPREAFA